MKATQIVRELEDAARQLGVRIRREKGSFRGGYCIRNGEEILMLNRIHPPEVHIAILATALKDLPIDSVYLKPVVRQALEEAWTMKLEAPIEAEEDE